MPTQVLYVACDAVSADYSSSKRYVVSFDASTGEYLGPLWNDVEHATYIDPVTCIFVGEDGNIWIAGGNDPGSPPKTQLTNVSPEGVILHQFLALDSSLSAAAMCKGPDNSLYIATYTTPGLVRLSQEGTVLDTWSTFTTDCLRLVVIGNIAYWSTSGYEEDYSCVIHRFDLETGLDLSDLFVEPYSVVTRMEQVGDHIGCQFTNNNYVEIDPSGAELNRLEVSTMTDVSKRGTRFVGTRYYPQQSVSSRIISANNYLWTSQLSQASLETGGTVSFWAMAVSGPDYEDVLPFCANLSCSGFCATLECSGAPTKRAIRRLRQAPCLSNEHNRLVFDQFRLNVKVEPGWEDLIDRNAPRVALQWTSNDGVTWTEPQWMSIPEASKRMSEVKWNRLGQSRRRAFRVWAEDPIDMAIVNAHLRATPGAT